ncbi:CoA-acylating methylmalonate-semialdehyde dehydrogenase [Bacteriovoracaceae bacterium]|nr:CoA-acylating methylmalonate-semialdehyde dehydrogenase [Bacteriovoracaceae bacterium]
MNILQNYINGEFVSSYSKESIDVIDPSTNQTRALVPKGCTQDVNQAIIAASAASSEWRKTPPNERAQYLYKLKTLLEEHTDELILLCTLESGKTLSESKAEMTRAIENVEVACGIPILLQSEYSQDIARGIDEYMVRTPVGIAACIAPFNFPLMIPFWFIPYAIACGNTYIVKPSEKVPSSMQKIFELINKLGLPPGVINMVHGGKTAVDEILERPEIKAISFVGSTPIAKYVYSKASAAGKRVQAQGGAKNPIVVMPDADMEATSKIIADSAFGCAGQRCLAAANIILVGSAKDTFIPKINEIAKSKTVGAGSESCNQMGAIITKESKERISSLIDQAVQEGAAILVDGRTDLNQEQSRGNFIKPTILNNIDPEGEVFRTEIFGPVMSILSTPDLKSAIDIINKSEYGNSACIFTDSGRAARDFQYNVEAGNVGVNIGVAAPMAFFPFSGHKASFFGDLHGQGRHSIEFFTQTKVVIERWPETWSRQF